MTPAAYWSSVALAASACIVLCWLARRHPGSWTVVAAKVIGVVLAADAASFTVSEIVQGRWSPRTSLPLALCDAGVLVAAVACWWRSPLLVEVTYFWGLAGTLQGVLTPDLGVGWPHLGFFEYVVGHLAIVMAALLLVAGMGITPRPGAVRRVFGITLAYTAIVGAVDAVAGANYMFLRRPPGEWTLLRLLGPWPWYIASAAGVALALLIALDAPFWWGRRASPANPENPESPENPANPENGTDTAGVSGLRAWQPSPGNAPRG